MRLLLCLLVLVLPVSATERLSKLKDFLGQREQIARIYMPQQATVGEPLEVLVLAPGASSVTVSGSRLTDKPEEVVPDKLAVADLGADGRANLNLNIPLKPEEPTTDEKAKLTKNEEQKNQEKKSKSLKKKKAEPDVYYLEAVLKYPNGEERKALVFGSNANYVGFNGVQILPPVKDNSGAANMARSFLPSMTGMQTGTY